MPVLNFRVPAGAIVLAGTLLAAGCGAPGPGMGAHVPQRTSAVAGGPGEPAGGATVIEGDHSNGTVVHIRVGDRLKLVLASVYWNVRESSAPAVLRQDGPARQVPNSSASCPPGVGCVPVQAFFTALAPGTAVITARRTTCGEALRCVGAAGRFALTVVVH